MLVTLELRSEDDIASPRPVPMTIPITAPNREMITDSERIIRLTCRRFIPTARSRPISWVRSNTDSIRVLTIPISAINDRQRQQHVDQAEQLVDAVLLGRLELGTALDAEVRVGVQRRGSGSLEVPARVRC